MAGMFVSVALNSSQALARKKGPLEGQPIVRNKLELRKYRFQLTPMIAMSLSQPYVHMGYVGAKAEFDITDWIGVRGTFGWGVINLDSQLLKDMNSQLPEGVDPGTTDTFQQLCTGNAPCRDTTDIDNPSPLRHDFQAGLTRAQWQASIDAVFIPFSGKLGLFSGIFTEYDIYVFGGVGLVGWQKHYNQKSTSELEELVLDPNDPNYCKKPNGGEQNSECVLHPVKADTGVHLGGSFGAGMHIFITDWVSMNLEFQDIVTRNNLTGLNATIGDVPRVVDNNDKNAFHNVTFQLGATFYMPFKAKRSN